MISSMHTGYGYAVSGDFALKSLKTQAFLDFLRIFCYHTQHVVWLTAIRKVIQMIQKRLIIAIVMLLALTVISGCTLSRPEVAMEETAEPIVPTTLLDGSSLYAAACDFLKQQTSYASEVSISKQLHLEQTVLTEEIRQTVTCWDAGTERARIYTEQKVQLGDYNFSSTAYYKDGCGYYTVGNGAFTAEIKQEAFLRDTVPQILLELSRYADISAVQNENAVTIHFAAPTSAETWLDIAPADFLDASGTARIDLEGRLMESSYTVFYMHGGYLAEQTISMKVLPELSAAEPVIADIYTAISDPQIPLLLERSCGYLMQFKEFSATMEETVACDAYGEERHQKTFLQMTGSPQEVSAEIAVDITLINHNRAGQKTDSKYLMQYHDGKYSTYLDGECLEEQIATADAMRDFCTDQLLGTVLLTEHIAAAEITDRGAEYILTFTASDAFAEQLWWRNLQFLYSDESLLQDYEAFTPVNSAEAYLAIDRETGLPTASGITGESVFSVQGYEYRLESQAVQEYCLQVITNE